MRGGWPCGVLNSVCGGAASPALACSATGSGAWYSDYYVAAILVLGPLSRVLFVERLLCRVVSCRHV
jgi:hypothetical protein